MHNGNSEVRFILLVAVNTELNCCRVIIDQVSSWRVQIFKGVSFEVHLWQTPLKHVEKVSNSVKLSGWNLWTQHLLHRTTFSWLYSALDIVTRCTSTSPASRDDTGHSDEPHRASRYHLNRRRQPVICNNWLSGIFFLLLSSALPAESFICVGRGGVFVGISLYITSKKCEVLEPMRRQESSYSLTSRHVCPRHFFEHIIWFLLSSSPTATPHPPPPNPTSSLCPVNC